MKQSMETRSFLVFLLIVTVLFGLVLEPFWGAIFWAAAVSVIFIRCSAVWCTGLTGVAIWPL